MWLWRRDNGLDNFTKFHSSSFSFRNAEFLYLNLKATWRSQSNIPFTFFLEQVNMNGSIGDRRRKKQNHSKCISDWDGKDASPREAVGPETECCLLFTKNRIFGLHNQGSSECDNARKCLPHYCGTLPWHRVPGFKCSVWLCALTYHVCLLTQGVETHQHGGEKTGCQMHHKVSVGHKGDRLWARVCECTRGRVGVYVLNPPLTLVAFSPLSLHENNVDCSRESDGICTLTTASYSTVTWRWLIQTVHLKLTWT